jgi:hypothetical protein
MIPTLVQQIIGTVVRAAVMFAVGWLASHGGPSLSNDAVTKFITEATPVAAVLVWSIYQKFKNRQQLMVAQASGAPLSENSVKAIVASGAAPSVMTPPHETPTLQAPAAK